MNPQIHSTLLEMENVSFRYPDGSIGLNDCSISILRGSRNALVGANGSGKTTLFQLANGLLRPQQGVVYYAGNAVEYTRSGLRMLRTNVGIVFQNPDQQLFSASVQEDVSFGPLNLGLDQVTVRKRVAAALDAVDMARFSNKAVHNLSFGQKKRVCIAGVLAMDPELMVLDEPTAGLDHGMQQELLAILDELHARGITLLLATHDINFAYSWADQIHLMVAGRCSISLDAQNMSDCQDDFSALGLPLPLVITLHRRLVASGLLASDQRPRSCAELLDML